MRATPKRRRLQLYKRELRGTRTLVMGRRLEGQAECLPTFGVRLTLTLYYYYYYYYYYYWG